MVVGQVDFDPVGVLGHRCVELPLFEHALVLRSPRRGHNKRERPFRTITTMERLSDLDRKILALLQREGRRSFADIGREVGLSTPAVKRRVDRLEDAGVIRGYAAVVDASKLGLGFEAIAEVYCADRTAPHDVLASVEGIPEVVSAVTVSGEPDAVLRVQVDDIRHLERLIETLRRRPNVVRTRTMIVLSVLVDRPAALP
jgi:Lrp/AsnC family leucine-responsive transcriptional regulator